MNHPAGQQGEKAGDDQPGDRTGHAFAMQRDVADVAAIEPETEAEQADNRPDVDG